LNCNTGAPAHPPLATNTNCDILTGRVYERSFTHDRAVLAGRIDLR
jgi:hypothetical protein